MQHFALLWSLLPARERLSAAVVGLLSLVSGLLEAIVLVLVVNVALVVAEGGETSSISLPLVGGLDPSPGAMLVVAAAAGFLVGAVHLEVARRTAHLSAHALTLVRERAVRAYAAATWSRQATDREGNLQHAVDNLATQTSSLVVTAGTFLTGALGLLALLVSAFFVDALVTLVVVGFGLALFLCLRPIARVTRRRAREFVAENTSFAEEVAQWTALAMDLRVFGVDRAEADRLSSEIGRVSRTLERTRRTTRIGSYLYRDVAILFLVAAVAALYFFASDVDLTSVSAVVLLVVRSLSYAQAAQAAMQTMNELAPNASALLERIDSLEHDRQVTGSEPLPVLQDIVLDSVTYEYEPGRPGLDGVSVRIGRGEALGVIGPSGSGKSTLVQVILRLRPPTSGTVTVSGTPYEEIDDEAWHSRIAFVAQEPRLFHGTVADNVRFLRPGLDRARLRAAAAAAHVLNDIDRLPDGFDTMLGPRGAGLSGGQRQRVAIARALAGEPQLLILDEPTSALDVRSERLLQETIEGLKGSVTMVIIAHRLSTLQSCDRVLALDGGRVQVIGTLAEAAKAADFVDEDAFRGLQR